MSVIPEGDIYSRAAKFKLPGAEKFEAWIFDKEKQHYIWVI
ncbi:hypothetical protein [Clostridium sp.]|nr:hypothetical protein [Clostridium sp.]MDR3595632.1 hypothetical protein [Clostridium sp.]